MIKKLIIILLLLTSQNTLYPMKLVPKYLNRNTPSFSNKEFQERIIKPPSFTPPDIIPKEMATHINSIDKDVIQMAKAAKARGFNTNQTAAIIGNLYHESKLNPSQKQYGKGAGRGLAQYTKGDKRYEYMKNKSNINNQNVNDTSFQFNHILDEMLHSDPQITSNAWLGQKNQQDFLNTDDLKQATSMVSSKFLRPGKPQLQKRENISEYIKYLMGLHGL